MEIIKKAEAMRQFDKKLYQAQPIFITTPQYWDGGIQSDSPLSDKAAFYAVTEKMSAIIKEVVQMLDEKPLIGMGLCEHQQMHAHWSDLESHALFRAVASAIRKNRYYRLSLPEDGDVVDLIVESNFRYFTHISLFLPKANLIIQPTCHTEVLAYTDADNAVLETLKQIARKHSGEDCKINVVLKGGS